jgi:uncharacterized membrane protein YeaQ/YmgE (transglycosylase-associated protein family)
MSIITNLIVQAVAGALGGNAAGGILKNINLGPVGNSITGAIGGGLGGQVLQALIPALTAATATASAGGFDIAAALGQAARGGVTGAIVTVAVGLIKNAVMGPKRV